MTPYFQQDGVTLYHGDCREILPGLPDESVSAVVTDPPYGLAFMGKRWDYDVPSVEVWAECLRVLKPGGHLLAFAGTRTQHRMAVRIEDAGFEIRDMIAWVYGSGFPKSLDVSKAIDKAAGAERETGPIDEARAKLLVNQLGDYTTAAGWSAGNRKVTIDPPATPEAKHWQGWGTALKPALEPITVARKSLIGTVAENVLVHGTGALNIDGCRVATTDSLNGGAYSSDRKPSNSDWVKHGGTIHSSTGRDYVQPSGRWPANLIHDGSEEVTGLFPETTSGTPVGTRKAAHHWASSEQGTQLTGFGDTGSAARFFYTAKADKADRGPGNNHPTVKPLDLMRYLVRLVCPIGGVVLDPFSGSGTTLAAAQAEGCLAIGVEREAAYCEIIKGRFHQRRLF